jgi:hypothetical protein
VKMKTALIETRLAMHEAKRKMDKFLTKGYGLVHRLSLAKLLTASHSVAISDGKLHESIICDITERAGYKVLRNEKCAGKIVDMILPERKERYELKYGFEFDNEKSKAIMQKLELYSTNGWKGIAVYWTAPDNYTDRHIWNGKKFCKNLNLTYKLVQTEIDKVYDEIKQCNFDFTVKYILQEYLKTNSIDELLQMVDAGISLKYDYCG